MIVVKYSPPHSLHKFSYGFCHWRTMVSSICLRNKTFLSSFHEYRILHNPVPFLSQGNMVSHDSGILLRRLLAFWFCKRGEIEQRGSGFASQCFGSRNQSVFGTDPLGSP
jgi:hypothetical protein